MKRAVRLGWLLAVGLGTRTVDAQEGELFLGDDVSGSMGNRTELSAPWRGGRHSGPVPDYHLVHRGDTLWDICGYYYGNPWDWPRVWANNPDIANPHWIYPNDRVRLGNGAGGGSATAAGASANGSGDSGLQIGGRRADTSGAPIRLRNTGYLDENALEHAGDIAGSPVDHMMLTANDEIYIRYAEGEEHPRNGTELTIYRHIEESERDSDESGELVRILGTAVVRGYDREHDMVRAEIIEAFEPIERGFRVAEVPRRIENVPPRANDRDLDTTISATLFPRHLVGDQQLVFVEVGSEEGVQPGNRFFVVHDTDPWFDSVPLGRQHALGAEGRTTPASGVEYPPEVVAEARVVAVRPHSSTLLVTRSVVEIAVGDRAQMRNGF